MALNASAWTGIMENSVNQARKFNTFNNFPIFFKATLIKIYIIGLCKAGFFKRHICTFNKIIMNMEEWL